MIISFFISLQLSKTYKSAFSPFALKTFTNSTIIFKGPLFVTFCYVTTSNNIHAIKCPDDNLYITEVWSIFKASTLL